MKPGAENTYNQAKVSIADTRRCNIQNVVYKNTGCLPIRMLYRYRLTFL